MSNIRKIPIKNRFYIALAFFTVFFYLLSSLVAAVDLQSRSIMLGSSFVSDVTTHDF